MKNNIIYDNDDNVVGEDQLQKKGLKNNSWLKVYLASDSAVKESLINEIQECMTGEVIDFCEENKIDPLNLTNRQLEDIWSIIFEEDIRLI